MCSVFVQLCDICVELTSHVTVITLPIDALAGHHVVIDVVICVNMSTDVHTVLLILRLFHVTMST